MVQILLEDSDVSLQHGIHLPELLCPPCHTVTGISRIEIWSAGRDCLWKDNFHLENVFRVSRQYKVLASSIVLQFHLFQKVRKVISIVLKIHPCCSGSSPSLPVFMW